MAREIQNISVSLLDQEGNGIPDSASASYTLIDPSDSSYRSRGSFSIQTFDIEQSMVDFMREIRLEICVREGLECASSSSSSSSSP